MELSDQQARQSLLTGVVAWLEDWLAQKPEQAKREHMLAMAASEGSMAAVQFLLDQGVNPRANGSRPLVWAIMKKRLEMVVLLLPFSDVNDDGCFFLRCSISSGSPDITRLLLPLSNAKEAFLEAVRQKTWATVKFFEYHIGIDVEEWRPALAQAPSVYFQNIRNHLGEMDAAATHQIDLEHGLPVSTVQHAERSRL